MSGIPYDLTRIKAFAFDVDGVLSASTIPLYPTGEPMRMINIKDGYAIQLAVKYGYEVAVITGGNTEAVRKRFEGLGVKDVFMGVGVKLPVFEQWLRDRQLDRSEVLFMGDDIPDLEIMQNVGLPACPADAAIDVKQIATYTSPMRGGKGCARDVIEQTMRAQGNWLSDKKAFGW